MAELAVSYHLIPDGITTIVELEIKGQFYVETAHAAEQAEQGVCKLLSRLTGQSEDAVRQQMEANRWLGEGWRPQEPGDRDG